MNKIYLFNISACATLKGIDICSEHPKQDQNLTCTPKRDDKSPLLKHHFTNFFFHIWAGLPPGRELFKAEAELSTN